MSVRALLHKQFNLPQISMLATFWQPGLSQGLVKKKYCANSAPVSQKDTIDMSRGDQGIWLTPHVV